MKIFKFRSALLVIQSKAYYFFKQLKTGISFGKNVRVFKLPIITTLKNTKLIIGDNVILNSDNKTYHINMHSRCKILLDRPGAFVSIGDNSRINGSCIHAYKKITIGKNCLIAANCIIIDGNGHELSFPDVENRINTIGGANEVIIEDNVWLGANVTVLPGVKIGYGSVISASAVVNKDIPPMSLAGGNPVQIIKSYKYNSP